MRKVRAAIILARMDSSRFPGKALEVLGGIPIIELIYRRLKKSKSIDRIVLATTSRQCDIELVEFFEKIGGEVYRGRGAETNNVCRRFISAAKSINADYALRVNGDSPFPMPALIDTAAYHIDESANKPILITNLVPRSYPYGISVEWIRIAGLDEALASMELSELEHVTLHIYKNINKYTICPLPIFSEPVRDFKFTVDERNDLIKLEHVIGKIEQPLDEVDLSTLLSMSRLIS